MPEQTLTFVQAVNAALDRALRDDPNVIVFGEDVGLPGGIFGATKGLKDRYGDRVFDMPISEAAILGSAIGAAQHGMRPVAEIMWSDFSLVAFDQIANQASNTRYVSNGTITAPLTIRMQQGVLAGSCAQHSQSLEALFAHLPGIRVCMPSTPQDAYDLLLTAIACDDPTIVIENRAMYFTEKATITTENKVSSIGGAAVRRSGTDVTMVSWSRMVNECLASAKILAERGIEAEVVDLRWLNPLDMDTVLASVAKTSRLVVVHEANLTGGFGAEIAARGAELGFCHLDRPVERIGAPDLRIAAAPHIQAAVIPQAMSIADRISGHVAV